MNNIDLLSVTHESQACTSDADESLPGAISPTEPGGPSLAYDHDYAMLMARMAPRSDAQYGGFVDPADAPNWTDIERDCQRLLRRTLDIDLLVWLCRARTRLRQAAGLARGLSTLHRVLCDWPDAVHPQLRIDGVQEPALRANALAALADPEGLLADIGDIVLVGGTAARLNVRDVERAFAIPRAPQSANPEAIAQQLDALRRTGAHDEHATAAGAALQALAEAAAHARAIDAWASEQLGEDAPPLQRLVRLLAPFAEPALLQSAAPDAGAAAGEISPARPLVQSLEQPSMQLLEPSSEKPASKRGERQDVPSRREDVSNSIRAAREWFELNEPSSPVAVLLKQAERMVGKRFAQVADAIPLDLLQRWDAADVLAGSRE